ncbi:MAG: YggS family pyridoxal phosphate-dependent enzyme, partial [Candidatus Kapabacteria bacterium]|nr:YggS family pyridoxal phosphate-dependent enzyme [Candidatus Kapabacteria bacterium]
MPSLKENVELLRSRISLFASSVRRSPAEITIVAVSKSQTPERIAEVVHAGIKNIGENYVQELQAKYKVLSHLGIRWHFIGRIQTNKIKYLVPIVYMVHSVDRESVAIELNRQAEKYNRVLDILLQVNTSGEQTKAGVLP